MRAYSGAVARGHWHAARSAYEACLTVYAQEESDAPPAVRGWGVELLVAEGAWEDAMKLVEYDLSASRVVAHRHLSTIADLSFIVFSYVKPPRMRAR